MNEVARNVASVDNVSRLQVVQSFLDLFEAPQYLEVGVCKGITFKPIKAGLKVAVDPHFREGVREQLADQINVELHEVTSDAFFGSTGGERKFDVIYLDGLHTFEQTLRDLLNAIVCIKDKGIIIIDDVYPSSYHSSLPDPGLTKRVRTAIGATDNQWMGDVYKLVFFIDSFLQQFSFRMVSNNHGQLVLWRNRRATVTERQVEAVARAPFESLFLEEAALRRMPLDGIVDEVASDLGLHRPQPTRRPAQPRADASPGKEAAQPRAFLSAILAKRLG